MRNFDSPLTNVRMTGPGTPRVKLRTRTTPGYSLSAVDPGTQKHDHAQMFADRCAGMTWKQIAAKHGINGEVAARTILENSRYMHKITPEQAAAYEAASGLSRKAGA